MTATVVQLPTADAKSASTDDNPNTFAFTKKDIAAKVAEAEPYFERELQKLKVDPKHKIKPVIFRDADTVGLILKRQRRDWKFAIERRINGRIFRHTLRDRTSSTDLKALRAEAAEIMVQVRNGTFVTAAQRRADQQRAFERRDLETMTLGQALTDYAEKNPQLTPKTLEVYAHAVARAENLKRKPSDPPIMEFVGTKSTRAMRGIDLDFARTAYDRIHSKQSASSAAQTLRTLRTLWTHWTEELPEGTPIPSNPVRALTKKKGRVAAVPVRETSISPDDRAKWVAAMRHEASRKGYTGGVARALLFMYFTGLRRTEALAMRWAEVGEDTITIPAERMKANKELVRPITPEMRAILDEQRAWNPDAEFVFPSVRGNGPVTDTRRTKAKIGKASGVDISNHDLRRTYIAAATTAGVPEVAAKMLVGHTIEDITQQYAQAIRGDLLQHALKVEEELKR